MDKWERMQAIVNQPGWGTQVSTHYSWRTMVIGRALSVNVIVFILQYTGLMLTTLTSYSASIWFASGTAYAFVILRGPVVLPGIALGTALAYFMANAAWPIILFASLIFTLQPVILRALCFRWIGPSMIFYTPGRFIGFLAIVCIVTGLMSALLCFIYPIEWLSWFKLWAANFNGTVILSLSILTLDAYFPAIDGLAIKRCYGYVVFLVALAVLLFSTSVIWQCLAIAAFFVGMYYFGRRDGWCGAVAAVFLAGLSFGLC